MRKTAWMLVGWIGLTAGAVHAADAPLSNPDQLPWARWQGRLSLGTNAPVWQPGLAGTRFASASLMGDYYFGHVGRSLTAAGGFRATSGLIYGARTASLTLGQPGLASGSAFSIATRSSATSGFGFADSATDGTTMPYLGVVYTGLSVRSGWSFSADLGLVAQTPGGVKLVRSQSLDDVVREMRLAPLVQVGVSYAF